MDELNLEPLKPLESSEPKENQVEPSGTQRWNYKRLIIPAGILLSILLAALIYLIVAPAPEKIIAQVFRYDIVTTPDTARVVLSISNKEDKRSTIVQLYPVIFGREHAPVYSRSIERATIEEIKLPLALNPGEVRVLKINFFIKKKDLDECADKLKDSSHIVVFQNGPPPGQLEGFLGLGWLVVDGEGRNYTNTARLAYYVLTPTPPGFADPTALTRSWILSDEPFELCTQTETVK